MLQPLLVPWHRDLSNQSSRFRWNAPDRIEAAVAVENTETGVGFGGDAIRFNPIEQTTASGNEANSRIRAHGVRISFQPSHLFPRKSCESSEKTAVETLPNAYYPNAF